MIFLNFVTIVNEFCYDCNLKILFEFRDLHMNIRDKLTNTGVINTDVNGVSSANNEQCTATFKAVAATEDTWQKQNYK
jgi:hypothetical protein